MTQVQNGNKSCTLSQNEVDIILDALQAMMCQYNKAFALCPDRYAKDAITTAKHAVMEVHGKLCNVASE